MSVHHSFYGFHWHLLEGAGMCIYIYICMYICIYEEEDVYTMYWILTPTPQQSQLKIYKEFSSLKMYLYNPGGVVASRWGMQTQTIRYRFKYIFPDIQINQLVFHTTSGSIGEEEVHILPDWWFQPL